MGGQSALFGLAIIVIKAKSHATGSLTNKSCGAVAGLNHCDKITDAGKADTSYTSSLLKAARRATCTNEQEMNNTTELIQLEQRHAELQKQHDGVCIERDTLLAANISLTDSVATLRSQMKYAENQTEEKSAELKQKDNFFNESMVFQDEAETRLRRRMDECERLRADLSSSASEVLAMQARLREVQLQLSDLQSQQLPKDHELSNLQHERDALVNKVAFLEEDAVRRAEQHVGSLVIR